MSPWERLPVMSPLVVVMSMCEPLFPLTIVPVPDTFRFRPAISRESEH